jgi:hypothetical protein
MSDKVYQDLLRRHASEGFKDLEKSKSWFRQNALSFGKRQLNRNDIIGSREHVSSVRNESMIGKLFMFAYDPKTKDKLPFYDVYPLVFPFKIVSGGFYGLNMHYLQPNLRAILMDILYSLLNYSNLNSDRTRLHRLSYEVLNASANFVGFKPCVKHYLASNIRSNIAYIPPKEWELALFLPLQMFKKKNDVQVWKDSKNQLTKR